MTPTEFYTILEGYHRVSKGYNRDPAAVAFPRILLGPGEYLARPFYMTFNNITHIINCADDGACPEYAKQSVGASNYTCLYSIDELNYPILERHYSIFEKVMNDYLRDVRCKNVYVHCQAGMNRSACLLIAYIHKRFGVPLERIIHSLAKQRPCILTNRGFQKQLLDFK